MILKVLMEHPPKQGLKQLVKHIVKQTVAIGFNGTSTKTRIETMEIFSFSK